MAPKKHRLFELVAPYEPAGDQPQAIESLCKGIESGKLAQVLMGVTGSGKTYTMAQVIARTQRPTLVLSHNKTLAAQLFSEFREFFPRNAVEYFVSYYDYYQPEAYIPSTDTYIEKDSQINEEIDKLRHSATRSLFERDDVLIVSSISCIYGLGSPESYEKMQVEVHRGEEISRQDLLRKLVEIQYRRNDVDFHRGTFRVRGDVVDIFPAYEEEIALRVEFLGDEVERISELDPLRGMRLRDLAHLTLYPASHYVTTPEHRKRAIESIRVELREVLAEMNANQRLPEAQRLSQRTLYDLEMLDALGFCQGIENYSRHLTGRRPGEPPPTLLEYFPPNWLIIVDESHVTVPQIGGMYRGDRSRKTTLVEHGFRLPSALDNRPLNFEEFNKSINQAIYVSATPGQYEIDLTQGEIVEQVIRPTGLLDPLVEVRPAGSQVDDLLKEARLRIAKGDRVLITTLTKRLAEDLTRYYQEQGIRVKYLHSDIETLERIEILRDLRLGTFDVLVGINLLREGLDLPEVSLIGILDADKEGFLRSARALIQTIGRAARNSEGLVILYADRITNSMRQAIDETARRRKIQEEHNRVHGITPLTIQKAVRDNIRTEQPEDPDSPRPLRAGDSGVVRSLIAFDAKDRALRQLSEAESAERFQSAAELEESIASLEKEMRDHAKKMEFEKAAQVRDRLRELKTLRLAV